MDLLTVQEATEILNAANITHSSETLKRWIREGKIKATKIQGEHSPGINRKEGYHIEEEELNRFIERKNPHYLDALVLNAKMKVFQEKQDLLSKISDLTWEYASHLLNPQQEEKAAQLKAELDRLWAIMRELESE
ncbi:helix-turn-helix domain-containing protein [Thermoactinomyces sp. DSM 45892]|uniref:helix-turn-helix domain-containing protein n=1 Tax=Thermoactinomyces sp. DSM 45892 TaxID=1882753 RepID=UPI00089A2A7E|nr:helix-turn-helix domain-containing protein [Thermoactinomyces sp. DSM 45892]SDY89200.1 Helix-turn-helix domain-containing protein [Thermoactinomyces sp. DSM 45892]